MKECLSIVKDIFISLAVLGIAGIMSQLVSQLYTVTMDKFVGEEKKLDYRIIVGQLFLIIAVIVLLVYFAKMDLSRFGIKSKHA